MKFKNEIFLTSFMDSLNVLGNTKLTGITKAVMALRIAKNKKLFLSKFKEFMGLREELIKKFGTQEENGDWVVDNKNMIEFRATFKLLCDEEFDLDTIQITLEKDIDISGNVLTDLMDFVEILEV